MCELAGVSRASFYRSWEKQEPTAAEMAVRDAIQRTAIATATTATGESPRTFSDKGLW
jgi:hypothetical protein